MKLLTIMMILTLFTIESKADLTVNSLFKYGINGYTESGGGQNSSSSSSSTTKNHGITTSTSSNSSTTSSNVTVDNRYQLTPGIGFEVSPHNDGIALGAGYYFDNTFQMSLGYKLF